ncbi:MAG: DUF3488 and transglutaminase-like domain-containing protein [Actinomycetota bacterium]|nr:DUF3488 and transglutaminase-like domain-containing protein [Actinomycetota bacterium]
MGSEARARIGLACLLGATIFGYELVFDGDGYSGPVLVAAGLAMGIVTLARRWGAGSILSAELSLAGLVVYLSLIFQVENSFYGLPTPRAATGLSELVSRAVETSQIDIAPVPVRAGYVVLLVVGMWVAATIGELATFRWRRPLLASLPCVGLLVPALVVGTGVGDPFFIAVFLAALFTYWALESSHRLRTWGRWVTTWDQRRDKQPRAVEPSLTGALARRMGASCIAATLVAPLFLPSLGEGWFSWKNGSGDGSGSGSGSGEINLLVDARPRPISQSNLSLFRVRTTATPGYWRLASLALFDGQKWQPAPVEFVTLGDAFVGDVEPLKAETVVQDFELTNLKSSYLPAVVEPTAISDSDAGIVVEDETNALKLGYVNREGFNYNVESERPDPTFEDLLTATIPGPGDPTSPGSEYYDQPVPAPDVRVLGDRWTQGIENPFLQLVNIQAYLRSPEFTYSTDVESGASSDYLREFLLETKTGFCQQFATAFAVLARHKGYPVRVSVGFLPGERTDVATEYGQTPDKFYDYVVRGTDAHAWPEVYFEDYGWIAFDPTPSASREPFYTQLPPGTGPPSLLNPGGAGAGAAADQRLIPEELRAPQAGGGPRGGAQTPAQRRTRPEPEPPWQETFGGMIRFGIIAALLWLIGVPLVKRARILRRYASASDPGAVVRVAFAQFEEDAAEMAAPRSPWQSPTSFAVQIATMGRAPEIAATKLAQLYETAEYSGTAVTKTQGAEAKRLAWHLRTALWARATYLERARALFSVRVLLSDLGSLRGRLRLRPAPS